MNALQEVKAVELELGDTLDITLPPDYVSYVRYFVCESRNRRINVLSKRKLTIGYRFCKITMQIFYLTIMVLYLKVLLIF
jgi:hypothetical protein